MAKAERPDSSEFKGDGYELFMAALAILSIVNIVLFYLARDTSMRDILLVVNFLLTIVFVLDFIYRMITANSRVRYFTREYGWADLLSCVPLVQFKVLRFFRLIKVYRLFREKGVNGIWRALIRDRAGSAFLSLLFVATLMIEFGSLAILKVEVGQPGANIENASDAIWYTVVTMSTVGYGDQYPVTNTGRVIGTIIIIVGVGIFGTLTGWLANAFLSPRARKPKGDEAPAGSPNDVEERLAAIKDLSVQQQAAIAALEEAVAKDA